MEYKMWSAEIKTKDFGRIFVRFRCPFTVKRTSGDIAFQIAVALKGEVVQVKPAREVSK